MGKVDVIIDLIEPVASELEAQWRARLGHRYTLWGSTTPGQTEQPAIQAKVLSFCLSRYTLDADLEGARSVVEEHLLPPDFEWPTGRPLRSRARIRELLRHIEAGNQAPSSKL
ncbi:MAG: hypothetical protein JO316_01290 [Abitibacteriaceae bacterium]|nr:hypothetical protein [Abditibacteriaceae bacterium]